MNVYIHPGEDAMLTCTAEPASDLKLRVTFNAYVSHILPINMIALATVQRYRHSSSGSIQISRHFCDAFRGTDAFSGGTDAFVGGRSRRSCTATPCLQH